MTSPHPVPGPPPRPQDPTATVPAGVTQALARLDELELSGEIPPGSAQPLRQVWVQARARVVGESRGDEPDLVALRLDLARVQGEELDRRRREGRLPPEVARALRAELDLQEVRLGQAPSA